MTREEALAQLRNGPGINEDVSEEYNEAVDMAIEALKQESCEDTPDIRVGECEDVISRDDAIKAAETMLDACSRDITEQINTLNNVDWMKMKIRELPPVQPKSGWIPVSERLPKPNQYDGSVAMYCLVQNEYGDMLVASYDSNGWRQIYHHDYLKDEVVAWMFLPKLYSLDDD